MNNIRPIAWKKYTADRIHARTNHIFIMLMAAILLIALGAGVVDARNRAAPASKPGLSNVRDYAAAVDHKSYAIDGGVLFAGGPNGWVEVPTPDGIIVGAVTLDRKNPKALYIGAANALAIYRSTDGGDNWQLEEVAKGAWRARVSTSGVAVHGSRPWTGRSASF